MTTKMTTKAWNSKISYQLKKAENLLTSTRRYEREYGKYLLWFFLGDECKNRNRATNKTLAKRFAAKELPLDEDTWLADEFLNAESNLWNKETGQFPWDAIALTRDQMVAYAFGSAIEIIEVENRKRVAVLFRELEKWNNEVAEENEEIEYGCGSDDEGFDFFEIEYESFFYDAHRQARYLYDMRCGRGRKA